MKVSAALGLSGSLNRTTDWRITIRRRIVLALAAIVLAGCGGGDAATTTSALPSVTSVPPLETTTTEMSTSTTTTLPPSLAGAPVFDRWTTILASLPVDEWDEASATEEAFEYIEHESGLLLSADYPSLNPGYWVVFSGDFATQEDALAHCRELQAQGVSCYHRYLGDAPVIVAGRDNGSIVAWVDNVLSVVDADGGDVIEVVSDAYQGGVFPGPLELGADATGVFFGMGFEDYWYTCEASAGRIDYVDLTSGEATTVATGYGPQLSPDGTRLAYIASTHCVPDPDNEIEVISFADAVAVLDLVTGRVQTWGPSPGVAETPGSFVSSIAWTADGVSIYVSMDEGALHVIDTRVGAAIDATPTLGPGRVDVAFGAWVLEGVDAGSGNLLAVEQDYAGGRSRVIEISTTTGLVVDGGAWLDGFWVVELDGSRTAPLLSGSGVVSGAPAGDLGPDPWHDGADW